MSEHRGLMRPLTTLIRRPGVEPSTAVKYTVQARDLFVWASLEGMSVLGVEGSRESSREKFVGRLGFQTALSRIEHACDAMMLHSLLCTLFIYLACLCIHLNMNEHLMLTKKISQARPRP